MVMKVTDISRFEDLSQPGTLGLLWKDSLLPVSLCAILIWETPSREPVS